MRTLRLPILLMALAMLASCASLDPAGVYKGDKVLYGADLAIVTAHDQIDLFLKWEVTNRGLLASNGKQSVTKAADDIRKNAPQWFGDAKAARDLYATASTTPNQSALQTALEVLQAAATQAMDQMATALSPTKANAPNQ